MANRKMGRSYYVDIFSDYGLDERQRAESSSIGFRCFRMLYLLTLGLTAVWFVADCAADIDIPAIVTAGSYFAAAIVCYCIYAIRAARSGVINGITAFSFSAGSLFTAVFCAVTAIVFGLGAAGRIAAAEKMTAPLTISVLNAMLSAEHFILYFCGRKNNKVLDEQNIEEDSSDEQ